MKDNGNKEEQIDRVRKSWSLNLLWETMWSLEDQSDLLNSMDRRLVLGIWRRRHRQKTHPEIKLRYSKHSMLSWLIRKKIPYRESQWEHMPLLAFPPDVTPWEKKNVISREVLHTWDMWGKKPPRTMSPVKPSDGTSPATRYPAGPQTRSIHASPINSKKSEKW